MMKASLVGCVVFFLGLFMLPRNPEVVSSDVAITVFGGSCPEGRSIKVAGACNEQKACGTCSESIPEWRFNVSTAGEWSVLNTTACYDGCANICGYHTPTGTKCSEGS